jgi:hypothetical protein
MDESLVRMATAFHGGGGCHKDILSSDLEDLKHPDYAPTDSGVTKMRNVGGQCGALSAGMMMIGYLFGRRTPEDDITCASELAYELQNRFQETLGAKDCSVLKPFHVKISADPVRNKPGTCGQVYYTGAKLAVEVILSAREVCPLCPDIKFPV